MKYRILDLTLRILFKSNRFDPISLYLPVITFFGPGDACNTKKVRRTYLESFKYISWWICVDYGYFWYCMSWSTYPHMRWFFLLIFSIILIGYSMVTNILVYWKLISQLLILNFIKFTFRLLQQAFFLRSILDRA